MLTISQHSCPVYIYGDREVCPEACPPTTPHPCRPPARNARHEPAPPPHSSISTSLHPKELFSKWSSFGLKLIWLTAPSRNLLASHNRLQRLEEGETSKISISKNMDAAYVKQSSFDKLTAGWFSREETAYWARMISPRVSPASSMRLLQHVWIPTARKCGSSCQLQADKFNIDRNEDETCTINFTLSSESNKLTRNTLNVFFCSKTSVCVCVSVPA